MESMNFETFSVDNNEKYEGTNIEKHKTIKFLRERVDRDRDLFHQEGISDEEAREALDRLGQSVKDLEWNIRSLKQREQFPLFQRAKTLFQEGLRIRESEAHEGAGVYYISRFEEGEDALKDLGEYPYKEEEGGRIYLEDNQLIAIAQQLGVDKSEALQVARYLDEICREHENQ